MHHISKNHNHRLNENKAKEIIPSISKNHKGNLRNQNQLAPITATQTSNTDILVVLISFTANHVICETQCILWITINLEPHLLINKEARRRKTNCNQSKFAMFHFLFYFFNIKNKINYMENKFVFICVLTNQRLIHEMRYLRCFFFLNIKFHK